MEKAERKDKPQRQTKGKQQNWALIRTEIYASLVFSASEKFHHFKNKNVFMVRRVSHITRTSFGFYTVLLVQ